MDKEGWGKKGGEQIEGISFERNLFFTGGGLRTHTL